MQIEVIDNCCTEDDPEAVVPKVGNAGVGFFSELWSVGQCRTFDTCIECAGGHVLRILHADHRVEPGFNRDMTARIIRGYRPAGPARPANRRAIDNGVGWALYCRHESLLRGQHRAAVLQLREVLICSCSRKTPIQRARHVRFALLRAYGRIQTRLHG